jgi:hypothetical protein
MQSPTSRTSKRSNGKKTDLYRASYSPFSALGAQNNAKTTKKIGLIGAIASFCATFGQNPSVVHD